jgi:hypothetical protein
MNDQEATPAAILKVGEGRGFVVESANQRLVITAAHCLPYFPPCASVSQPEEHTYQKLLGHIEGMPKVWADFFCGSNRRHSSAGSARRSYLL